MQNERQIKQTLSPTGYDQPENLSNTKDAGPTLISAQDLDMSDDDLKSLLGIISKPSELLPTSNPDVPTTDTASVSPENPDKSSDCEPSEAKTRPDAPENDKTVMPIKHWCCEKDTDTSEIDTPKELADRYQFIKPLGSGAQGKVYLAKRLSDGQMTAIKQLRIDSIKTWKEYTLFHREAEVLSGLDIPGVVKFYEACDCLDADPPCSYIVQEYIEGMTLKQMLKSGFRFSPNRVFQLVLQLLDILEKLHTHEPPIIHRDIKPSNIILKPNDENDSFEVYLIDFGAVANPQIQSGGSTIAGTFGYMSPEQNLGRPTPQSDTYALAALTAYILSGIDPADMMTQDMRLIIDPYIENHPRALVQTLRRMLEPNLEHRLADIGELRRRFVDFKNGIYVLEQENYQPFSQPELADKLKHVEHLCQPRSLEIWQNLPDIPSKRSEFPIDLKTNPRFKAYPYLRDVDDHISFDKDNLGKLFFIISFATIPVGIFTTFILSHLPHSPIELVLTNNITLIMLCPILISAFITIEIWFIIRHKKTFFYALILLAISKLTRRSPLGILPSIKNVNHQESQPCPEHLSIFQNGLKTIATITAIEYVPTPNYSVHTDDSSPSETPHKVQRVETSPVFRIFYKFNPPDDDTERDLIHYIDTHRAPDDLFKVGDPLPILYTGLKYTASSPLHVTTSMPYPFPLQDLEHPKDYIGSSQHHAASLFHA